MKQTLVTLQKSSRKVIALAVLGFSTLALSAAYSPSLLAADNSKLEQQRADFVKARTALRNGQHGQVDKLLPQLQDYPLTPYLEYWRVSNNLSRATPTSIQQFLTQHDGSLLAERLRTSWLLHLARAGKWQQYLDFYRASDSVTLTCFQRRALYKTGNKKAAFDGIEALWLVGKSQPRECDPLFAAWRENGGMSSALVWQRIELAMAERQVYLASYLERFLPQDKKRQSELWRAIHRQPETVLKTASLKEDSENSRQMVAYGLQRLALRQPYKAAEAWDRMVMDYQFDEQQHIDTESAIALALARAQAPEAMHWLSNIADNSNEAVRQQRVLTAVNQQAWPDALFWFEQLSAEEQADPRWQYWRARAFEEQGMTDRANIIYQQLSSERDYYGFLAADKINASYAFEDRPLNFDDKALAEIANRGAAKRAHELYRIGETLDARREWYHLTKQLDVTQMLKASQLAHKWGWHDRAIVTMGQTEYRDALELRFPLLHRDHVTHHAGQQQIDPSWAYAVIRQESAFIPDARSPKGAMGLMQIMPNTGKTIARTLKTPLNDPNQLLDVATNIRFGVSYLRKVMDRFDDNTVLATAAYNAGSQRVRGWLPEDSTQQADQWIENVPFKETRNYLKNVLTYSVIYDQRMQRNIVPLKQRMPMIVSTAKPG